MTRWGLMLVVLVAMAVPAEAQPISGDVYARRLILGATGTSIGLRAGSGSPEGVETAPVGTQYLNITDGKWWRKATGSGNTGWIQAFTATGAQFCVPWFTATDVLGCTTALTLNGDLIHSTDAAAGISALRFSTNTAGARLSLRKSRGTASSPTVIVSGDVLGRVNFDGWDGDSTIQSASVIGASSGTIADGRVPSELQFWTSTDASTSVLTRRWTIDNAGHLLPFSTYAYDAGSDALKIRTLYAAELMVQTIVAQEVISTIGGEVVVAPTTVLVDVPASVPATIVVKHNNLAIGDRVVLKKAGQVEWMAITAGPTGSAGAYTYEITRNLDGSGENTWAAGDAVMNTGTTGDGFIDLSALQGLIPGSTVGPTIAFNVRTGTTWNNIATRAALGNLNGLYGYVADTYGAAFGDNSAAWVKIDPTNGIRIGHNATTKVQIDASGNATFTGTVTAAAGAIGGWSIGTDYIRDTAGVVGMSSAVTGGDDIRFWAGDATPSSAEFRVTEAGVLTASSGTIGGFTLAANLLSSGTDADYVAMSSGGTNAFWAGDSTFADAEFSVTAAGVLKAVSGTIGGCTLATGSLTCGTGDDVAVLSSSDATYRFWAGNASGASAPFSVDKDGYLRTSSATFGSGSAGVDVGSTGLTVNGSGSIVAGSGNVVIDNSGILLDTIGTAQGLINWTDGGFVGVAGDGETMQISASGAISLITSVGVFISPPTTTSDVNPIVLDGTVLKEKTDGYTGSGCSGVDDITVESGIVVSVACTFGPKPIDLVKNDVATLRREIAELRELLAVVLRRER